MRNGKWNSKTGKGSACVGSGHKAGTAANPNDIRMVPDFEAPNSGAYNWLNSGKYAGRRIVDAAAKMMKISVYDVSGITINPDAANLLPTELRLERANPWAQPREATATLFR